VAPSTQIGRSLSDFERIIGTKIDVPAAPIPPA
jgi:hypothetical protein